MIARKKTYNSIARSFRSKPSLLICLFFSKNGRQIKKLKQKPGERHPSRIFSKVIFIFLGNI